MRLAALQDILLNQKSNMMNKTQSIIFNIHTHIYHHVHIYVYEVTIYFGKTRVKGSKKLPTCFTSFAPRPPTPPFSPVGQSAGHSPELCGSVATARYTVSSSV